MNIRMALHLILDERKGSSRSTLEKRLNGDGYGTPIESYPVLV